VVGKTEAPESGLDAAGIGRALRPPRIAILGVGGTDDQSGRLLIGSALQGARDVREDLSD
jgi:hypothetical protein